MYLYMLTVGGMGRFSLNRSEYCILNQAGRIILSEPDAVYALRNTKLYVAE